MVVTLRLERVYGVSRLSRRGPAPYAFPAAQAAHCLLLSAARGLGGALDASAGSASPATLTGPW